MSRIGKLPVKIPSGVTVTIANNTVTVKGPKGQMSQDVHSSIGVEHDTKEGILTVNPKEQDKKFWAKWGLYRVLINNMVTGVTSGFQRVLEIEGLGYKSELKGKNLFMTVGYSHPIMYVPPSGITFGIDGPTKIVITGIDKQLVGQVAANIRNIRLPEPYKGKGIKYQGEKIKRKAGKTGAK